MFVYWKTDYLSLVFRVQRYIKKNTLIYNYIIYIIHLTIFMLRNQ